MKSGGSTRAVWRAAATLKLLDPRFETRWAKLLALIVEHAYGERYMSSYMIDGALLGNEVYLRTMIADAADNAEQHTNFYCAACGLALTSDGLLGSAYFTEDYPVRPVPKRCFQQRLK